MVRQSKEGFVYWMPAYTGMTALIALMPAANLQLGPPGIRYLFHHVE